MKKSIYFFIALGMIVWLGGSLIRNVIIFDIFVPAEVLTFKNYYTTEMINYSIYLFTSTSLYTSVAYGVSFLLFLYIAIAEKHRFKNEGWLFMSIALFLLVSPVVLYNMYSDYQLSKIIFDLQIPDYESAKKLIFARYKSNANTVLSGISYLAAVNIVAYAVFKPLVRNQQEFN